ncbi:hypothetical protein CXF83_08525 [Shewanella sp. Choline-02u-19]|uniref:hypothetical protein n=1 Tax=unclassified Shewanella TaxID=196818 RepID=UPI000C3399C9|nr:MULTISPECIES: hypothetical protein [unclassified Shewanella]PKH61688.1 hypothetical protein CXF84_01495 [Shewanella sp. Bg11-22]PKI26778.1 hypothetical protein CXF83_08525 [Shewanella sp. Choline-02u-19]
MNSIPVYEDKVIAVLNDMRSEGVTEASTINILELYQGGFHSNKGIPASISFNANFGKWLQRNSSVLEIKEQDANQAAVDNNGRKTTCSIWAI